MMFGPHDSDSPNTPILMRWGVKSRTNDELRQEFIDQVVPELHALGLSVPDPDLRFDDTSGHWQIGKIDWDEFWRVVSGKGPCNLERMQARQSAHDEGAWVREALAAYAQKQGAGNGH
jgi:ring-1,2-phenylacetyl-CoA epoxidase subunit PaaA